ncbi:MAG TPA: ABC transporter permease [Acidimicrobiales bacterium]|nr:ABC transporter permease [Acidimicrobiales bacterium]
MPRSERRLAERLRAWDGLHASRDGTGRLARPVEREAGASGGASERAGGSWATARRVLRSWSRLGGLLAAVLICAFVFDGLNTAFLSANNILNIFKTTSSLAIISLGEMIVLLVGEIDLSVGSVYGLGAMVTGLLWTNGTPFVPALLAGLATGVAAGIVNGFVTTVVRVNSFIATLGMLNLAEGIDFLISNSASINPNTTLGGYNIFAAFGQDQLFGQIPVQIAWLVGISLVMYLLVHRSMFGFRSAAIGGNPSAARVAHLPVRSYKVVAFALAGLLAVVGGIMDFSLVGATDPTSGSNLPFTVFAAVIIGGASLSGGRGTVWGTFLGALFLTLISNGLSLLGYGAFVQLIFVGLIIIVAVAIDWWTGRGRESRAAQVQW